LGVRNIGRLICLKVNIRVTHTLIKLATIRTILNKGPLIVAGIKPIEGITHTSLVSKGSTNRGDRRINADTILTDFVGSAGLSEFFRNRTGTITGRGA